MNAERCSLYGNEVLLCLCLRRVLMAHSITHSSPLSSLLFSTAIRGSIRAWTHHRRTHLQSKRDANTFPLALEKGVRVCGHARVCVCVFLCVCKWECASGYMHVTGWSGCWWDSESCLQRSVSRGAVGGRAAPSASSTSSSACSSSSWCQTPLWAPSTSPQPVSATTTSFHLYRAYRTDIYIYIWSVVIVVGVLDREIWYTYDIKRSGQCVRPLITTTRKLMYIIYIIYVINI